MNKKQLPEKTCPVCLRPFKWRKKWEKDWDQVVYCSKGCQKNKDKSDFKKTNSN